MAADQRKKKRVNAASLVGCTSREKYRSNRRKLHIQQHDLKLRPNISLEWNNRKKSVVSKKEQIGFSRRHLIPYVEPGSRGHNILADVLPVPAEIFELENLCKVLSYEVWQSLLSDDERSFLSQFLPKDIEPDKVVLDLLSGDNVHFGNPFIKWGASLCLGEHHPDTVLHEEQSLKVAKEAYYSFLEKYHNDMIDNLQTWKEKWLSCEDPEVNAIQNIWRKHDKKSLPTSDSRFCCTEEDYVGTPDSCSWANSEIAYSSDNQNLGTMHGESHRRRDFLKKISDSSSSGIKVVTAAPRKGEKLNRWNIPQHEGAKYMSYIKVSREQHERVKSRIKYAGNSIQPRSLNNVLGSFDSLDVQPFAIFEEEESRKLHEYWVNLATKDVPLRSVNWRKIQLQRKEQLQSLVEEIGQKVGLQETLDEVKDVPSSTLVELSDGEGELPTSNTNEEVEKEQSDDLQQQSGDEELIHEMASEAEDQKEIRNGYIFEKHTLNDNEMNKDEDEDATNHVFVQDHSEPQVSSLNNSSRSTMLTSSSPGFLQDQQQISSLDSNPQSNSMEMESHGDSRSGKDEDTQLVSGYLVNVNHVDIPLSQGASISSSSDVWPVGDAHSSYYQSNATSSGYASTHELLIGHPPLMQGQAVQMLNLEIRQDKDARKDMLHRQTDNMSFFSSYSNQERSGMLHSLLKGQSNLSCHQPQKHSGMDFHPGNDAVMETAQFSGQLGEHVHPPVPMDVRQKKLNDMYLHQNIQDSLYSGGRFAVPRQEDLAVNVHNWATVNSVHVPVSCQPHMNSGEVGHNWYMTENGNGDGWPSLEAVSVSHGFNSGGNSDQTLFSVLTECNELPRVSFNAMGSTERLIQAGNFNGLGGGTPSSSNFLTQTPNPLIYLSGQDTSSGIRMNTPGWIGLPQQNSGLQEPFGKPFLRSWNQ